MPYVVVVGTVAPTVEVGQAVDWTKCAHQYFPGVDLNEKFGKGPFTASAVKPVPYDRAGRLHHQMVAIQDVEGALCWFCSSYLVVIS
ncbi:MAG: hypothetical protein Q8L24_02255 [bacterium]|nr:hypothetical protein [bacterium]